MLCVAVICAEVERAEKGLESELRQLLKLYNWGLKRGNEVKGSRFFRSRKFKEIGPHPFVKFLEGLEHAYKCEKMSFTITSKERLLIETIQEVGAPDMLIVDVNLISVETLRRGIRIEGRKVTVKMRDSKKVPGIQLADLVANWACREEG